MAAVAITALDRYTNLLEFTGANLTAIDDWLEIPCHSSSYTFAATSHALIAAGFNPLALGVDVGVKARFLRHHFIPFFLALPASLSAMAIACLRLFTLGPLPGPGLPLCSVPCLNSPITFATFLSAFAIFLGMGKAIRLT